MAQRVGEADARDVRAGEETSIEIPLHTGVAVTVRFADPSGRAFDGELKVELRDPRGVVHDFSFAPRDGAMQWTGQLLPGTYHVSVRAYSAYSGVTLKGTIN